MNSVRFKAFISYSHADEHWAAWLHRALESYGVPKRLVGTTGLHGTVPANLAPVFRDRDELSSASDLSGKIKGALDDSEALVVICSPAAAQSKWVNEEIRHFRSLGRGGRIYCLIVDGDPQASDPLHSCFPPAILVGEDEAVAEPLAADARKWGDGKQLAKLKLVSGILGIRLDELRRRELQRKRKMQAIAAVAMLALAALILFSVQSRIAETTAEEARKAQQEQAENMLAQFLEQSERLDDVADLETRKAFSEATANYLAKLNPSDLTPESRRQLGVAFSKRGVILRTEGHLEQALEVFKNARQILQLLVNDSPGDADALFELSQAEYWVGAVHLDMGRVQDAKQSFQAYADVSHALHRLQPDNADWTMEAAYAQSNLGIVERRRIPSDPYLMLGFFQSALELNREAAALDTGYERELAESHADLADAWLGVCELHQALASRQENVKLAARFFNGNPASNRLKMDYAWALSGLSWVHQLLGSTDLAIDGYQQSIDLFTELVSEDPSNDHKRWNLVTKSARKAQLLAYSGEEDQSWDMSLAIDADMRQLIEQEQNARLDNAIEFGAFLTEFADLAHQRGDVELAERLLQEAQERLSTVVEAYPDNKKAQKELAILNYYHWKHSKSAPLDGIEKDWITEVTSTRDIAGCTDLNIAARRAVMAGADEQARAYSAQLVEKGYHEPEFVRFCREFELCDL